MFNNKSSSFAAKATHWLPQILLLPLVSLLSSCGTGSESGADPGIETFPIAYVKRSILVDRDGDIRQPDIRSPLRSTPGGDIFLKQRATIGGSVINITSSVTNGMGDVKDLDVSSDGKLLIFSLLTEDPDPDNNNDNPKWDIYTYNRETSELKRVIKLDITAELGDDIAPYFLDNNRIVFSSNRQKRSRAVLSNEDSSKPQFSSQDERNGEKALVLHTMSLSAEGGDIKQISFNQSHDLDPIVLSNGRILFSRWDNMFRNNAINLYTILADGSDLQPYYGTHDESHQVPNALDDNNRSPLVQFTQPRELSDGRIMLLQLPFTGSFAGGEIVTIDGNSFVDLNQPANQGVSGSALQKVTGSNLKFDGNIMRESRYSSFFPLNDGTSRILVSEGLCQIAIDTNTSTAADAEPVLEPFLCSSARAAAEFADPTATITETFPAYGIWLYDSIQKTSKPVVSIFTEPDKFLSDVVVMRPYNLPNLDQGTSQAELDSTLVTENAGLLNIRSVYDFGNSTFNGCFLTVCTDATVNSVLQLGDPSLATANQRPARFIRLVKAVGMPNRRDPDLVNPPDLDGDAFGPRGRALGMKEIIGYSPIQPDGSVLVKVPADVAFYFDILDKDARRIGPRHENWLQVNAGDTLTCTGCHTHPGGNDAPQPLPHGRKNAEAASININAPSGGFYPNTLDPSTGAPYLTSSSRGTMAEALSFAQNVPGATPSVNIIYNDVWTDDSGNPIPTTAFTYAYTSSGVGATAPGFVALNTPSPFVATSKCEEAWNSSCRTIINYQEHIQPIWGLTPRIDAESGLDVTCTSCHASTQPDPADPTSTIPKVPAAQLDLLSFVNADGGNQRIESYEELFFNDIFQDIVDGVLINITIDVTSIDENGDSVTETIPDPANPQPVATMSANGARFSYFIEKMTETELNAGRTLPTPTVNHANMLTSAELRLISEYLDIGGQYFNNPFDPAAPRRN